TLIGTSLLTLTRSIVRHPVHVLWQDFEKFSSELCEHRAHFVLLHFVSRPGFRSDAALAVARLIVRLRRCADAGQKGCYKDPPSSERERDIAMVRDLPRDFEDHCWKDLIDADTIEIYQAYRRKTYVGDNPAVLAIDLYNKAYQGGNRPVREVDREFSGSCGGKAYRATP